MHVGHLRSTLIGDALVRVLGYLGATVVRQNHVGDWGTQFGMLIQYISEHPERSWRSQEVEHDGTGSAVSALDGLYRAARATFDADPVFKEASQQRVVALQPAHVGQLEEEPRALRQSTHVGQLEQEEVAHTGGGTLLHTYAPPLPGHGASMKGISMGTRTIRRTSVTLPGLNGPGRYLSRVSSLEGGRGRVAEFHYADADLRELDLSDIHLWDGKITGLRAHRTRLEKLRVDSVEFSGCDLSTLRWTDSRMSRTVFRDCRLMGAARLPSRAAVPGRPADHARRSGREEDVPAGRPLRRSSQHQLRAGGAAAEAGGAGRTLCGDRP
jgi:hypothetical protein